MGAGALYSAGTEPGPDRHTGGADFALVDPAGRAYSLASFPADSVIVLYFGYTTCLRSCPTTLDNIAQALDDLGAARDSVRPVFVDLDPDREALASLPLYMQAFGPTFLGLTGTPDAVAQAADAFEVKVERIRYSSDPTDYSMLHQSPIFVLRPGDAQPTPLPATSPPEAIEAALRQALARPTLG
jgi:protein SCO1/2